MKLTKENIIALFSLLGIFIYLLLRWGWGIERSLLNLPLYAVLLFGGGPLIYDLCIKLLKKEFSSDLLAAVSIITSVLLGEYLAGSLVVLMLSGGQALESYAVRHASSVLQALAKRIPNIAHRKTGEQIQDIPLSQIKIGDTLVIYPHEISPVDGTIIEGHGVMDEAYLTGEPFEISKAPGSAVLSGSINGDVALTIRTIQLPSDSRYAKIVKVIQKAEENRPRLRRLGDQLGAFYTPLALIIGLCAWIVSEDATRFLAVLVVATPCPLLIAIPVAIIGSISLAAKRGIIIKDTAQLEQMDLCETIILDKTGTLTYGEPQLTEENIAQNFDKNFVLKLAASLEQYSKHPLARAILGTAKERHLQLPAATQISEPPGQGLRGTILGKQILITNRKNFLMQNKISANTLPPKTTGLECVVGIDGAYAATYGFHDGPRRESKSFIHHLGDKHHFKKIMLVSGDRESEVRYLADQVGIKEVYGSKSPEEKVAIVVQENKKAKTLFLGDGINDAPALMTATVGVALGQSTDIITQAAGAVIMESSLVKVDEFFHISRRMRSIAKQSAIGGMALSLLGMFFAMLGFLPPVTGAIMQEVIDIFAIVNALRVALPPKPLSHYES